MPDLRATLVNLMRVTITDEKTNHTWTYKEIRPLPVPATWRPGQKVVGDCSKGVQYLCKWAGAPDPMESNFGPYGNSQTIWLHAQHGIEAKNLLAGDAITFGVNGSEHVTMVLEPGDDPLLWSFGHQGAPETYRLSQDTRPHQLCHLPIPTYVPTPVEQVLSKTGWFSWVAWRLGEGDWKTFGKANPSARPNVPKLIPVTWWTRYAQFLLNRTKGS